jgi:hypothetical protein
MATHERQPKSGRVVDPEPRKVQRRGVKARLRDPGALVGGVVADPRIGGGFLADVDQEEIAGALLEAADLGAAHGLGQLHVLRREGHEFQRDVEFQEDIAQLDLYLVLEAALLLAQGLELGPRLG